jgi:hypothetical protein
MMRASTQRKDGAYHGVIRDEKGAVIWVCEHPHRNRDNDEWISQHTHNIAQRSALNCARIETERRSQAENKEMPMHPLGHTGA